MKQFRIKRIHVLAAGLVVAAVVVMVFFSMFIKPLNKQISKLGKDIEAEETVAAQQSAKERELAQAEAMQKVVEADYDHIVKTRMPKFPTTDDPIVSMIEMWDFPRQEGELIDRWF